MSRAGGSALAINQGILETSKENMKVIAEKLANNLELQGIILRTISDYEKARQQATEAGTSVAEVVKRKRTTVTPAVDDDAPPEVEDIVLRRGQTVYKNWATKLCSQLLHYLDPQVMDLQTVRRIDDLSQYQHLLQYGCDLLIWGESPDKIGSTQKRVLFAGLKHLYQQLGSRFSDLDFQALPLGWKVVGHFKVQVQDGKVMVLCKRLNETIEIPPGVIHGDPGPYHDVENNSSLKLATMVTRKDSYRLQNFFPRLSRSLKRRLSDELGVIAGSSPGAPSISSGSGGGASRSEVTAADAVADAENVEMDEEAPQPIT